MHVVCKASLTGGVLVVKFLERWLCRGQCSECPCYLRVTCVCSSKEPVGLVPHLQRTGACDVGDSNISRAVVLIWIQRPGAAAGPEEPATHPMQTAPGWEAGLLSCDLAEPQCTSPHSFLMGSSGFPVHVVMPSAEKFYFFLSRLVARYYFSGLTALEPNV